MSLLGIDLGSSSCKAVVFSVTGGILAEATEEYTPVFIGPAMVEMDPRIFRTAMVKVTRTVAAQAKDDPIEAMCVSSHGETLVPLNGKGEPLGSAIMNVDNRAAAEAEWWTYQLGRERIFQITGVSPHAMFPLSKIQWLRNNDPARYAAARFSAISDYLLQSFGLPPYLDFSLCSRFMALDVQAKRWSQELLYLAGISAAQLPTPVPAGTVAGRLSPLAASELGLPDGTLVAVGGHDQPCGALGVGAIEPGAVSDSLGTFECLLAVGAQPSLGADALNASLNSYCHVAPNRYITIAFFPSGIMMKWFGDLLGATDDGGAHGELYTALEAKAPNGPTGLLVTPHLIGSCTPYMDARATGVIAGLTPATDRARIYKGILEGLACELALNAEVLQQVVGPFDTMRVTGGGTRSALGLRLRAALTRCRLEVPRNREAVCLGAAMLAGVAAGVFATLEDAITHLVQVTETVEPDPGWSNAYLAPQRRYRQLYAALAPLREKA